MSAIAPDVPSLPRKNQTLRALGIIAAFALFCAVFLVADQAFNRFISARFTPVGSSAWMATLYGVVSRLHLILPLMALVIWRPKLFGYQVGATREHVRMLLAMLVVNCGLVAGYLWLTGSGTPYSGNVWLFTEVVTVPVVEETMWRGVVYAVLLLAFRRVYPPGSSSHLAVWVSGLGFGLLHASNALVGIPLQFALIQALSAAVWGVMYGYARARTDSVYPSIVLHGAMNLVVILF